MVAEVCNHRQSINNEVRRQGEASNCELVRNGKTKCLEHPYIPRRSPNSTDVSTLRPSVVADHCPTW
jgi:hypothetical protein